jgi:chromate transporter
LSELARSDRRVRELTGLLGLPQSLVSYHLMRENAKARAFLDGAGPAAIGAILGAAITLAGALHHTWQFAVLAAAVVALLALRRGVVETLIGAGAIGVIAALVGAPLP